MTELEKRLAEKFSGFLGIDGDGDMYVKGQPFNAALALWRECLKLMERNAELEKLRESDALTAKIEYGNALGCAEAAESENKRLREALEKYRTFHVTWLREGDAMDTEDREALTNELITLSDELVAL